MKKIYIKRDIENKIISWLGKKQILVIKGPRQVGKSTLMKKLREIYINEKNYDEKKVFWISFEDEFTRMSFEENALSYVKSLISNQKNCVIFIDEVQYSLNSGKNLKWIYDDMDFNDMNLKIIVTGSSSLDLNKLGSYLVGRALFFDMYPFTFREFLRTKEKEVYNYYQANTVDLIDLYNNKIKAKKHLTIIDKLNNYMKEYLTYGGYPDVVLEKNFETKKILLRNIFNNYIEKDIVSLYGIREKDSVIKLLMHLANIQGNLVVTEDICSTIGINRDKVQEILQILEDTFILKRIRPFFKNLSTEIRKNPKIYFYDMGLRNMLLSQFSFVDFGNLYEWFIFNIFKDEDLNFYRTRNKTEVDFIIKRNLDDIIPIEVKSQFKIQNSFYNFISEYTPKFGIITDGKIQDIKEVSNIRINILPISLIVFEKGWD